MYKLSEEKQFEYFLATIEEASRHVRSLLFILLITSIYVVVAAYTGDWKSETLMLPIVEAEISRRWFFIISPIFILFNYVYMHLYLKDLMKRGMLYNKLDVETTLMDKRFFLFPWVLPIGSGMGRSNITKYFGRKLLNFCVDIIFWWYGPFVLLVILMAYIFQQDIAALVPYVCFCLSIIHYVMNSRFQKTVFSKFLMTYLSLFLFFITLTAVPAIPEFFGFAVIDRTNFPGILRFFIKAYFIIYFAAFAIPKTWKSDKTNLRKTIWIMLYALGIIFFLGSAFDANVQA